ncbi:MAG: hypothetical protein GX437_13105, partial [Sphingobacteriales bacterium]|nr:hypothetical protein [Sphingobacteriales bacterium]
MKLFLKILLIILIFTVNAHNGFSQKEARYWALPGFFLDFYGGDTIPSLITGSNNFTNFANGTISDAYGNLLFYTNGATIWNRNNDTMKNGDSLFFYPGSVQGALIIPYPGDTNLYFLFTLRYCHIGCSYLYNNNIGLYYHLIDKRGNNGLGEVISKNNQLFPKVTSGKLTAVKHANNEAIWVISHKLYTDEFCAYLITKNGLDTSPVISRIGIPCDLSHPETWNGQMKASPDNKLLAVYSKRLGIEIFQFDNKTGKISNPIFIDFKKLISSKFEIKGIEFSPEGRFLYLTVRDETTNRTCILQFDLQDLSSVSIINSMEIIIKSKKEFEFLQSGIDGRIYCTTQSSYLAAITSPSEKGKSCNFKDSFIYLKNWYALSFPDIMPSFFFKPAFHAKNTCLSDTTLFAITDTSHIDSVLWCFGDSLSTVNNNSTLKLTSHCFTDTGVYNVVVYVWHDKGEKDTLQREIRISFYPKADFLINDSIQCLNLNKFICYDSSSIVSGSFTWEWDFGDKTKSYVQNPVHQYNKAGEYDLSLRILSDYGCEAKIEKKVK